MKYIQIIVIILLLVSCQNHTKLSPSTVELQIKLDTIFINQKGRIIDLNYIENMPKLSLDNNTLFLFNSFDHSIDAIDLKKLEFIKNYPFSKHGPNGTGEYVNSIQQISDTLFFIKSFGKSGVFNLNGKLSKRISWNSSKNRNNDFFNGYLKYEVISWNEEKNVFALNYDESKKSVGLNILSIPNNTFTEHYIDPDSSYRNYTLTVDDPNDYSYFDPYVYMSNENNLILITHQFSNEILVFDLKGIHKKTVRYNPNLTNPQVNYNNENGIPSLDYLKSVYIDFLEQVSYGPLVWDNINKKYIRLSSTKKFSETIQEGEFWPDLKKSNVYISLFDSSLNFIHDFHVKDLNSIRGGGKYFAKDGKLWMTQNFSDELGFIIIDYNTK